MRELPVCIDRKRSANPSPRNLLKCWHGASNNAVKIRTAVRMRLRSAGAMRLHLHLCALLREVYPGDGGHLSNCVANWVGVPPGKVEPASTVIQLKEGRFPTAA